MCPSVSVCLCVHVCLSVCLLVNELDLVSMSAWMENGWSVYLPGHRHGKEKFGSYVMFTESDFASSPGHRIELVFTHEWKTLQGRTTSDRSVGLSFVCDFRQNVILQQKLRLNPPSSIFTRILRYQDPRNTHCMNGYCMWWKRNENTFEFSYNTQSWQCWHFCTTSNENKLEVVTSEIMLM